MRGTSALTGRRGRTSLVLVVAGLAVLGLGYVLVVREPSPTSDPLACEGSVGLCDRRLDQVVLAGTHNSMNAADDGFISPDQEQGIAAQLEAGVRLFLVDAWLGSVRTAGDDEIVYTDVQTGRVGTVANAVSSPAARRATRLRRQAGAPAADAPREVYLCHAYCELGAVRLDDVVALWRSFLEENPDEVLVAVIQDELPADELLPALEGIDPYLATLDPSKPLPTLRSMVESGHRMVLGLENGDLGPRIPNVYADGLVQDVPYNYRSLDQLTSDRSCRRFRGSRQAPLFLLNNWISPASPEVAEQANARDTVLDRADRCARRRARAVNLVAVDFAEVGDVVGAVEELNATP